MNDGSANTDESLSRAGLVLVDYSVPPALPPLDAWKKVIGAGVIPEAVVAESPDYLEKADRQWREIATREQILNGEGSFWIHVAGRGSLQRGWQKVMMPAHAAMAENLGVHPGEPEFITMDLEERAVCAVTTEEDGIWIIVSKIEKV